MANHIIPSCLNNDIKMSNYSDKRMVLINYANEPFKPSQKLQTKTALRHCCFDEIIEYSDKDIDCDFYIKHKKILDNTRGGGLWLWKPYIMRKTLEKLDDGDICLYVDSGAMFVADITPIINILQTTDVWVTDIPLIEKQWTKRICFEKMRCEGPKFEDTNQIAAGFIAVKKSDLSIKFIQEWLDYCCDYELISPLDKSVGDEIPDFCAHREDESILSLLAKKYDIKPYSSPIQYVYLPEAYIERGRIINFASINRIDYEPFLLLHRSRRHINYLRICVFKLPPAITSKLVLIYKRIVCGKEVYSNFKNANKLYKSN